MCLDQFQNMVCCSIRSSESTHVEEIIWQRKVSRAQRVDSIQTLDSVQFVSLMNFINMGCVLGVDVGHAFWSVETAIETAMIWLCLALYSYEGSGAA